MESIKLHKDFFFKSYQKFKEKCIEGLSIGNIPKNERSMVILPPSPIVDEPMP